MTYQHEFLITDTLNNIAIYVNRHNIYKYFVSICHKIFTQF